MGVFLRWGVFGILAVAALVYAYNSLGHLADRRKAPPATVVAPPMPDPTGLPGTRASQTGTGRDADAIPEHCAVEIDIARRAAESRSIGEPLDRLLRIQEIAWQKDEKLRARYTRIATRWYEEQSPVDPARLRRDVLAACGDATP